MNLSALIGGTYFFQVSLKDTSKSVLASTTKKFFVYKPGAPGEKLAAASDSDVASSEYAVMSEPDLDQEFDHSRYISIETERRQYELLTDLNAKRRFHFEFWRRHNPDPLAPPSAFKGEYQKRVEYANQHLSTGFRGGWKTDRGRVYIVYGAYDEIERFPSSSESNPYEIWHYNNLQGGVIFVFVDRNGLGDYLLVHSSHRDELRDEYWFQHYAQKTQ